MAAPMLRSVRSHLHRFWPPTAAASKRFSLSVVSGEASGRDLPNPAIAVSKDGATIVCWHPEQEFPYELTKPLPRSVSEMEEGDSLLKVQHLRSNKLDNKTVGVVNKHLAEMFYTSRHPWDRKPMRKRKNPNPPKDRESI